MNEELKKMDPNEAAETVVDAWYDTDEAVDVLGSYLGMSPDCEAPEQDADDL